MVYGNKNGIKTSDIELGKTDTPVAVPLVLLCSCSHPSTLALSWPLTALLLLATECSRNHTNTGANSGPQKG